MTRGSAAGYAAAIWPKSQIGPPAGFAAQPDLSRNLKALRIEQKLPQSRKKEGTRHQPSCNDITLKIRYTSRASTFLLSMQTAWANSFNPIGILFSKYLYLIDELLSMRSGGYSEVEFTPHIKKIFLIISIMLISSIACSHGATLIVGNSPEGYESIQEAINSASIGDEILVYPGIYYENIVVDKRLYLIGLKNPVIDAGGDYFKGPGVTILADGVLMEGFTIRNSTNTAGDPLSGAGVFIRSNNNTIKGNILENNYRSGIKVLGGYNNSITNNSVDSNFEGILVSDSVSNKITSNHINNNKNAGIFITGSSELNLVKYNVVDNNSRGILLMDAGVNDITKNDVFDNKIKNFETSYAN